MTKGNILHRVVIVAMAAFACCLIAACSSTSASTASSASSGSASASSGSAASSGSGSASSDSGPADIKFGTSILTFNGNEDSAKLVADMEAGRIPTNCNVLYDTMGARPDVDVTDPETITEIYKRLSKVTVEEPTNMSITDSYHHVVFTLQDGTKVGYSFEGTGIYVAGRDNYAVANSGSLWSLVQQLQDEQINGRVKQHAIDIAKGKDLVKYYPREAREHDTVAIELVSVTDGVLDVKVNGMDNGEFVDENVFIFEMPEEDAALTVTLVPTYEGAE